MLLDPYALLTGPKPPTECVKPSRLTRLQYTFLPQKMGARECGVAAELDLQLGCEPPEIEALFPTPQEGRLRQVHLPSHGEEPCVGRILGQKADRGRVAAEWVGRKGIDLEDLQTHRFFPDVKQFTATRPRLDEQ